MDKPAWQQALHKHWPCPQCGSRDVHRSRTRNAGERLAKWMGARMYRRHACDLRFARAGGLVLPEWLARGPVMARCWLW